MSGLKAIRFFAATGAIILLNCNRSALPLDGPLPPSLISHPTNVVLLIGDGMGLTQMSASLYHQGGASIFEAFPVIGFHNPMPAGNLITDSAAGATAFACGISTYVNAIGMNRDTLPCRNLMEEAEAAGLATGIIVTSPLVNATPAAFVAHEPLRTNLEQIASDFLDLEIDLLIGGGKKYFDRRSTDERNLYRELQDKDYLVSDYFHDDLNTFAKLNPRHNFAFFTADNQPLSALQGRDYLPHAAKLGLNYLQNRQKKGFFLLIEGSQIDYGGHSNEGPEVLEEMRDFEMTIREVLRFAIQNGETLVIVTGDHETGGMAILEGSKMKKLQIGFTTNGHTGALVPVYAYGPQSASFSGVYANTKIYQLIKNALQLDSHVSENR